MPPAPEVRSLCLWACLSIKEQDGLSKTLSQGPKCRKGRRCSGCRRSEYARTLLSGASGETHPSGLHKVATYEFLKHAQGQGRSWAGGLGDSVYLHTWPPSAWSCRSSREARKTQCRQRRASEAAILPPDPRRAAAFPEAQGQMEQTGIQLARVRSWEGWRLHTCQWLLPQYVTSGILIQVSMIFF